MGINTNMKRLNISPGDQFSSWTVLSEGQRDKQGNRQLLCECKCGNTGLVRASSLHCMESKQCGRCSRRENPNIRLRPYEALFNQAKRWAMKDGTDWQLSYQKFLDLARKPICHYCLASVSFAEYCVGKPRSYIIFNH